MVITLVGTHLREVRQLGGTFGHGLRLLQHAGVDDHDVGELGCETQLHPDAALEPQIQAVREH